MSPPPQVDRQPDGLHLLHIFEVTTAQSGEVKCVAKCANEQTVCHSDLVVFPEIYTSTVNDEDLNDDTLIPSFDHDRDLDFDHNICPAYIICGPQDCTALIGGQVVLEVIYGGHPEPTIKWLKAVSYCYAELQRVMRSAVGWLCSRWTAFPTRDQQRFPVYISFHLHQLNSNLLLYCSTITRAARLARRRTS